MHEVDMTQCLLLAMGDWRRQHEPEQPTVDTVHLLVGDFTCVEPDQLVSTWKAAVAGSWLDGARLAIETVPLRAAAWAAAAPTPPRPSRATAPPAAITRWRRS